MINNRRIVKDTWYDWLINPISDPIRNCGWCCGKNMNLFKTEDYY